MKILTWNIGSLFFLKYAKYFGFKYRGQKIIREYFQPVLNGEFVSNQIKKLNPDILFLQEFYDANDTKYIEALKDYPYQKLVDTWYHEHAILVASKYEFTITEDSNFSIVSCKGVNFIPVHLNSFHASKRLEDTTTLDRMIVELPNSLILGDTNIWSRGKMFLFRNDSKAYRTLCRNLIDFSKDIISTSYFGLGLDKVFGSRGFKVLKIESPKTRSHFMDHYPITLDLEL